MTAAAIRAALTRPDMKADEIIAASGISKLQFQRSMGQMVQDGHVLVDRSVWPRTYTLGRRPMTLEEMGRRNAVHLKAINDARRISREEKARRKAERNRAYDAKRRKAQSVQRLEHGIAAASALALQQVPTVQQIEPTPEEMMAAFLARGGQVQALNPWDVSEHNRLKGRYA